MTSGCGTLIQTQKNMTKAQKAAVNNINQAHNAMLSKAIHDTFKKEAEFEASIGKNPKRVWAQFLVHHFFNLAMYLTMNQIITHYITADPLVEGTLMALNVIMFLANCVYYWRTTKVLSEWRQLLRAKFVDTL